jgi:hypothetical protein
MLFLGGFIEENVKEPSLTCILVKMPVLLTTPGRRSIKQRWKFAVHLKRALGDQFGANPSGHTAACKRRESG